jgi:hypothetical protein
VILFLLPTSGFGLPTSKKKKYFLKRVLNFVTLVEIKLKWETIIF